MSLGQTGRPTDNQDKETPSVNIFPVPILKALFSNSSYPFRTQEWFNLARNNVLRLSRTPSIIFWLVGWFCFLFSCPFCSKTEAEPIFRNVVFYNNVDDGQSLQQQFCVIRNSFSPTGATIGIPKPICRKRKT